MKNAASLAPLLTLAVALLACGCARQPTNLYYCSPGCFGDCTAEHMADADTWTREHAIFMAQYCHTEMNHCRSCIERIERAGNACGLTKTCSSKDP